MLFAQKQKEDEENQKHFDENQRKQ